MSSQNLAKPFPFRALLAGEMLRMPAAELEAIAGIPDDRTDAIWVYRRAGASGVGADSLRVERAEIQFWLEDGLVAHAHLHMRWADGLVHRELLH